MSFIAIIGAGALGGALADALARRSRAGEVRLIDPEGRVAEGKALDILQSSPVEQFTAAVTGATTLAAAAGADAIVVADFVSGGEIAGEAGLATVRQIAKLDTSAPLVFAGGQQRELMQRAIAELHVAPPRVLGSAPLALESAVRAIVAALVDASPADLAIGVAGVPPKDAVIGWDAATAFNQPIAAALAPHHLASISSRLPALWPPAPYALAAAGARVAEALARGSRRRYTCFAAVDATFGESERLLAGSERLIAGSERPGLHRATVAAVPVEIVKGGIGKTLDPSLSGRERTLFENGLR